MIKHIVMWKLYQESAGFFKTENALRIKQELRRLPLLIPQIKKLEVGININPADNAYDVVLNSEFSSTDDLEIYQKHSAHLEFKKFIKDLRSDVHIVDYEK
jgi:stress responsive alpha/beta barrel protein